MLKNRVERPEEVPPYMASTGQSDPTSKPDALVRVAPDADFSATEITVQEGFVLSRVDGKSTVKTLCLLSGMGEEPTRELLHSLWKKGLIVVGNRKAVVRGSALEAAGAGSEKNGSDEKFMPETTPQAKDVVDIVLEHHRDAFPSDEELEQEDVNIPLLARLRMHAIHRLLKDVDLFQLLGIDPTEDLKEIRRAYFRRSKEFHPDRYFNRRSGPYKEKLKQIFTTVSNAYRMLENTDRRQGYLLRVSQVQNRLEDPWQEKKQGKAKESGESRPWRVVKKPTQSFQERKSETDMDQVSNGSTYRFVRRARQTRTREDSGGGDKAGDKDDHKASSSEAVIPMPPGRAAKPSPKPKPTPQVTPRRPQQEAGGSFDLDAPSPIKRSEKVDAPAPSFDLDAPSPIFEIGGQEKDPVADEARKREGPTTAETGDWPTDVSPTDTAERLDEAVKVNLTEEEGDGQIRSILLDMSADSARTPTSRPMGPKMAYQRGLQQLKAGDMRSAVASLRTAISFAPDNHEYRKTYEAAVLRAREGSAEAYYQRGQLEQAAGHLEVAYGLFGKAAGLEPRVQFLLKAAQVAQQIGDLLAAQVYAKRAVEKQPYSKDARLMMAKILLADGRDEEARQELEAVLKTDPEHAEAQDLLEQITGTGPRTR